MKSTIALTVVAICAAPALANGPLEELRQDALAASPLAVKITSGCDGVAGSVVTDDGAFENGYSGTSTIGFAYFGQKTTPPYSAAKVEKLCVCLQRSTGSSSGLVDLLFHSVDPITGAPKELVEFIDDLPVSGVPLGTGGQFYTFDVSDANVFTEGPIYLGFRWDEGTNPAFFVCADESASTPKQRAFFDTGLLAGAFPPFTELGGSVGANYRALGIRAVFTAASCLPDADTLCLNNGRFKVEATWNTNSASGTAQVVKLTDETGYLWFFNANNVEAVVKVLNACAVNNRYWVFAGGLTDQGVVLTVTDTLTQLSKTYTNPRGSNWITITDTNALASCP